MILHFKILFWRFCCFYIHLEDIDVYLYLRCFLLMGPPEVGDVPPRPGKLRGDPGEEHVSEVDGALPNIASP
jgi:hypothetical protein